MEFEAWAQANGLDLATASPAQRAAYQAAWRASVKPTEPTPVRPLPVATRLADEPAAPAPASTFDLKMKEIEAEAKRQEYISEATIRAMDNHRGNTEKIKQLRDLRDAAVKDTSMDVRAFDLALMRLDRYAGPMVFAPSQPVVNEAVIEAAICQTHRLPTLDKNFDDKTLQAAHSRFRGGITIKDVLALAAERNNGYRGSHRDVRALCKAAFGGRAAGQDFTDFRADIGPSTVSVSGILSNVANKFLAAPWLFSEQSWRQVTKIQNANDFKQMSVYRLNGSAKFERIAPGGEIKHGSLSETSYTNQVVNYGKMMGLTYEDMVNDDLGAFISIATELSRGGSDSFNEVFWGELLDDAAFFNTDKSKNNYDDGATDSVLSLAGLENADAIFAAQTKPDGTPLGAIPAILLVPRGLRSRAATLMKATGIVGQGADAAAVPDDNPWAGMYKVVDSLYLSSTAITGYSATAWYLAADPMNLAMMWAAFLNGQETPVVETGEFEFDRLGLAMRAYMAFGCKKMEYRAAVKLKGAA